MNMTDPQSELTALNLAILNTLWLPDVEIRYLEVLLVSMHWLALYQELFLITWDEHRIFGNGVVGQTILKDDR